MEPSKLKTRLPEYLAESLPEQLWQIFSQSSPEHTPDEHSPEDQQAFLRWLHTQGHLNSAQYHSLSAELGAEAEEIEVTGFDKTEEFLRTRGLDLSASQDSPRARPRDSGSLKPQSNYDMLGMLGKGAMGLVHLAKDRDLQRKVAYKQLLSPDNRAALARFVREAQITAQLDHPHIVPIYGMEVQPDGTLAYSMKLVKGKTFKDLIVESRQLYDHGQPLDSEHSLEQLLDYFLKACDAVAFGHNKGVIHRDLKPANIMVGPYNEVYVMDWGIARVMHSDEMPPEWVEIESLSEDLLDERTRAGQILGTPRYMSPQQAAGKNDQLDGRSDQFALGLILYELLTLKPAFQASGALEMLKKVLKAEKEPWISYHPGRKIPADLQAIVERATAQKPDQRYASVTDLAADIRRYLRAEATLARPDNVWRKLVRWVGRHRELSLIALLLIIFAAALAIIWGLISHQREMDQLRALEANKLSFVTRVSQQSQHIDIYFQKLESLLQGLSKASTYAMNHGESGRDPWYLNDAYALPPRKRFEAPDLIPSPYYTGEISPVWPIFVLSPGVTPQNAGHLLRRLAPLRHTLKAVLMDSYTDGPPVPKAEWDQLLATKGAPLMWSYICLKEGIEYFYPGHDEPTKGYDARIRPYYRQSYNKHEIVWGAPYDDPVGGMLIPCTQGIFDEQQNFLGTVGIDIRINYVDHAFLRIPDQPAFLTSYLINAQGEIILKSGDALKPKRRLAVDEQNVLRRYSQQSVVTAIRQGQPGGTFVDSSQQPERLIAYYRLNTLGWYYVVEADYQKVLKRRSP